jgi:hypothetical protein
LGSLAETTRPSLLDARAARTRRNAGRAPAEHAHYSLRGPPFETSLRPPHTRPDLFHARNPAGPGARANSTREQPLASRRREHRIRKWERGRGARARASRRVRPAHACTHGIGEEDAGGESDPRRPRPLTAPGTRPIHPLSMFRPHALSSLIPGQSRREVSSRRDKRERKPRPVWFSAPARSRPLHHHQQQASALRLSIYTRAHSSPLFSIRRLFLSFPHHRSRPAGPNFSLRPCPPESLTRPDLVRPYTQPGWLAGFGVKSLFSFGTRLSRPYPSH